jgi:hypothetical protein
MIVENREEVLLKASYGSDLYTFSWGSILAELDTGIFYTCRFVSVSCTVIAEYSAISRWRAFS